MPLLGIRADYSKAWNGLGLLQCQGRLNEVAVSLPRGRAARPSMHRLPLQYRKSILLALDHNTEALVAFRRALTLDPGHALGTWQYRRPARALWLAHRG